MAEGCASNRQEKDEELEAPASAEDGGRMERKGDLVMSGVRLKLAGLISGVVLSFCSLLAHEEAVGVHLAGARFCRPW
jgi:hypothetical protein